jgi:hypothetical protein
MAVGRTVPVDYTQRSWWSLLQPEGLTLRCASLLGVALSLLPQWGVILGDTYCTKLVAWCVALAHSDDNGALMASAGIAGTVLQHFGRQLAGTSTAVSTAAAPSRRVPMWSALAVQTRGDVAPHALTPLLVELLYLVARHGVAAVELTLWARLLLVPDDGETDDGDASPLSPGPSPSSRRRGDDGGDGGGRDASVLGVLHCSESRNPLLTCLARVSTAGGAMTGDAFAGVPVLRFDLTLGHDDTASAFGVVRFPSLLPLDAAHSRAMDAGAVSMSGGGAGAGGTSAAAAAAEPSAGCLWPPAAAYTVATWLRVDRYDAVSPLHVLLMQSSRGRTEVDVSLAAGIITVTCCGRSVEFANAFVSPGRWHHFVVVHQAPRVGVSCCLAAGVLRVWHAACSASAAVVVAVVVVVVRTAAAFRRY